MPEGRARNLESTSVWIVDGHNSIFRIPAWKRLHVGGERRAARLALEELLERFGRSMSREVWVVYDGNELDRNPDQVRRFHLQSHYSNPPEEADDRIRHLAQGVLRDRGRPAVVSSDRRFTETLAPGVRVYDVERFFGGIVPDALVIPEKWAPDAGGADDLWGHFLRSSPHVSDQRLADELADEAAPDTDGEAKADPE